ncbi:HK97 family phage prohead protease [Acinetobacter seifertii]|uniref:HK97 family phage prohead protease n=2 Tax=Acinetobacter calcoaceticus/baumannii complex TaxID=909768 RepID=A0A7H2TR81_9GAMM|nr:HK97 family phage prohead protease [Acinetobacter seifertii]MBD1224945.1 HK97 family phage prohead protease [Acinetobacter seifertii]MBD1225940.1 HK97 family phage prohead protease [Acinetobacter seifertii]QNX14149.1 HK97 family phage prohead protease [Acinetobacter seifertii]QNX39309.1 HK97 family phage prohead protease [Acinetobacter seifertii]QNX47112.1 HK97 family phage prohead protease [Acinetobacter seifertii]
MNKVYFKMQEQTVQEDGFFSGYLAVFNNIDSHGDVIRKGAFLKTIEEWNSKGKYPAIFWNHDPDEPIGVFTLMREDEKGLYVEGRLLISDIVRAKSTYALMKVKAIDGMSIGYITIQATQDPQTMIRELLELELVEGSIVAFPSNPNSLISSVKSKLQDGELPSLPEFEKFLRESGFSKTQATVIASKGLRHLLSESEGENEKANSISNALNILRGISND